MNFNRMKFHFTHNTMRFKLNVSSSSFVEFSSRVGLSTATSFAAKVRRGAMCWKNRKDFQEFLESLWILPIWWFLEVLFCCYFQSFRALEKQETKRRRCEIDSGPERASHGWRLEKMMVRRKKKKRERRIIFFDLFIHSSRLCFLAAARFRSFRWFFSPSLLFLSACMVPCTHSTGIAKAWTLFFFFFAISKPYQHTPSFGFNITFTVFFWLYLG